jgi:hypothetical protein
MAPLIIHQNIFPIAMGIPDNDHDQIICWFMVDINAVNAAMARLAHDQGQGTA